MHEFDHQSGLFVPRKKLLAEPARLQSPQWMAGPGFFGGSRTYRQEVLDDAPWAYYPMDDTSGTSALNLGSTASPGTYSGAATLNQASFTRGGKSVLFSNTGLLNTGMSNSMGANLFAMECMFSPAASGQSANPTLMGKYSYFATGLSEFPITIIWNAGTSRVNLTLSKGDDFSHDLTLTSNVLTPALDYHLVMNYRPNGLVELWINNSMHASQTINFQISVGGGNWSVGRAAFENGGGVGGSGFAGRIAEAAIYYNKVLTSDRIAAHYLAR